MERDAESVDIDLPLQMLMMNTVNVLGVSKLMEKEDLRICCDCKEETNIYVCYIYEDDYYCELCCPDGYGE